MRQTTYQAITTMLNAFPQSGSNLEGLLLTYDRALSGVSDQAICEAAQRFVTGDVKEQSRTFAPSVAEFVQEARRIADLMQYRDRPRLTAPAYRRAGPAPFEIEAERLRQIYAGRPILAEGLSIDQWRSRQREFPHGHTWTAALNGTVFGPLPAQMQEAAE